MSPDRAGLAKINTFTQLVKYLRDELDWPIEGSDFEDLTFEYTPEELGIDSKNAAKIQEIKRLRPLSVNQPWGVFFVKFEPKRLPVVALRRILSSVVLKKRASANQSERTAWDAEDLLFISSYGAGDGRQISFAHFSQDPAKDDLPTLKILGWDNLDTPLHLEHVAEELTEHLIWPTDEDDVKGWRQAWSSAFTLRHREVVTTSKELAVQLAELARAIRDRIRTALDIETESGPLTKLMTAFQEALVHDLDEDGFADMYAQTIAYGLLSARIADPSGSSADDLAAHMPVTNPFLKELMETFLRVGGRKGTKSGPGIDFDEVGVNEVVALLDSANMEAVLRDFGDRNPEEDPVIHFYESFLQQYDSDKRMQRGVFYTPRPVVSCMVRSVHELLQAEFGLADGLADDASWGEVVQRMPRVEIPDGVRPSERFVTVLDPATGTGTFIVEVIDVIHRTLRTRWEGEGKSEAQILDLWNEYVPKSLLPRLHGYELLMAPYAIAHLKVGLKLYETGYRFESGERARIFLTNALEPAHDLSGTLDLTIPALAHEAASVNTVKSKERFTVILGNPPYSKMSSNLSDDAVGLVEPFRSIEGTRIVVKAALAHELNLQDDYVKFHGLLLSLLLASGAGIGSYISNSGYLDSPSLRGLRWNLMQAMDSLMLLNLGGRVADRRTTGEDDENVFEIEQGVAVIAMVRSGGHFPKRVLYGRVIGPREAKYDALRTFTMREGANQPVTPVAPYFRFTPSDNDAEAELNGWPSLDEMFPSNSGGVITSRDSLAIGWSSASLLSTIRRFATSPPGDKSLQEELGFSVKGKWNVEGCKAALRARGVSEEDVKPIYYRPFDTRLIYYFPPLLDTPSRPISEMVYSGTNLLLLAPRVKTSSEFCHVLVSRSPAETKACSHDRATQMFPIFLPDPFDSSKRNLNVGRHTSKRHADLLGADVDDVTELGTLLVGYTYAVLHSPTYRRRYGASLQNDYPRIPVPKDGALSRELAHLGGELVALHLMETATQNAVSARFDRSGMTWRFEGVEHESPSDAIRFVGPETPIVSKVAWSENSVWIDAAKTKRGETNVGNAGFRGVTEEVWNFHIGGYRVCEKWLKDRKGQVLRAVDIAHYFRIVIALTESIRLMQEIDDAIQRYGGWPDAFEAGARGNGGGDQPS